MKKESKTTSFLSENVDLIGNLELKGGIRIDGTIKGRINSRSTIFIGNTAKVEGDIVCESIVTSGYTHGNINADKVVRLNSPGILEGDVQTCDMHIERGAYFNGKCQLLIPQHNERPILIPPTPPRKALVYREQLLENQANLGKEK